MFTRRVSFSLWVNGLLQKLQLKVFRIIILVTTVPVFSLMWQAWERLEKAEHERELALRNELIRQEKLEMLAARFDRKAAMRETWLSENQRLVSQVYTLNSKPYNNLMFQIHFWYEHTEYVLMISWFFSRIRTTLGLIWEQWKLPPVNTRQSRQTLGRTGSVWLRWRLSPKSWKQRDTMMCGAS